MDCEDELNLLLQCWIKDKEKEMNKNEVNKENLLNISNSYQTRIKNALKKCLKSAVENHKPTKHINKGKGKAFIIENNL